MVSSFLGVSIEEAEIWIVNVIRTANIDAKIDSEKEIIFITRKAPAFTEIINTKMRDIVPRTNLLVNNLKRILKKD